MTDKVLKTIVIIVAIIAGAYVVPRLGCHVGFKDDPVVQMSDYNDYDKKPVFRVAFDNGQYYVEYKTYEMKNWAREGTPFPTKEAAQGVVNNCKQECQRRYNRIVNEAQLLEKAK